MVAVHDGMVVHAGADAAWPGRGLYVAVRGADGRTSYQMHLSQVDVVAAHGLTVRAGEMVGLSGNTGWSTGPHLHLGCRVDG